MRILRPFDWVTRFTRPVSQPREGYELISVIQPVLNVGCDWPLAEIQERRQGTLALGTNNFDVFPGEAPTNTVYPAEQLRHHAIVIGAFVQPGASLAMDMLLVNSVSGLVVNRLYTGAAATSHDPFKDNANLGGRLASYIRFPYVIRFQITAAAGTETFDVRIIRWDTPQSEPLLI